MILYPVYLRFTLLIGLLLISILALYAQTGRFEGTVLNEQSIGLQGVAIMLEPDKNSVQTDRLGNFRFEKLYPGTYTIQITHNHYLSYIDTILIQSEKTVAKEIVLSPFIHTIEAVDVQHVNHNSESPDQLMKLERSAMPVQIITRRMIELMGSRRLDEVLKEQTGMAIVNNVGGGSRSVGVQMQGFSSEYVMILIDGQPMVGRNNGNFDLSRISVSNIERIEIVKGASSCLFGSDALGGAINIITRHGAVEPQAIASLYYGSLNILDATLDTEFPFAHQRGTVNFSSNYYRTDGFNTNPYLLNGPSSPPYDNFATQGRIRYRTGKNSTLGSSMRYGLRRSDMSKDWGDDWVAKDSQEETDLNFSLTFDHTFRSGWRSMSRYYLTHYTTNEAVLWQSQSTNLHENVFEQTVHRFEQQIAWQYRDGLQLTGGAGGSFELMADQTLQGTQHLGTFFGYIQGEKQFFGKMNALGGIRYDRTSAYGGKINPSLGIQYALTDKIMLKSGIGSGFKAPDFRMRYQVFFNPGFNYLVIGSEMLKQTLDQMQANGEISEIFQYSVDNLNKPLEAERSTSLNTGVTWKASPSFSLEANVFYHRIHNQIQVTPVASGTSIGSIYSYQNLPNVVNKGLEANLTWSPVENLHIQIGYQYMLSRDLSVVDSIRTGNWPYNQNLHDPKTGNHYAPGPSDYWGIESRSRHMLNARAFYSYRPWDAQISLRLNYRGKYPFVDYNGNGFIDRFDHFVPAHSLLNALIEKKLYKQRVALRLTADNILDFKHQFMPGQPGRVFLLGASYRWHM